jgi:hypothetical protein
MRLKKLALAAAAVVGAAGLTGVAAAAIQNSHVMTVQLPDGATAHIRYFGDTPPEVRVEPTAGFAPLAWAGPAIGFAGPDFASLRQAIAEMDRQADLMLAESQDFLAASPQASGLLQADLGKLPPGTTGYSVVSTLTPKGICSRSVEYRARGDGQPQVITRTSGDCGDGPAASGLAPTHRSDAPRLTSVVYRPAS